jgi:hypothetical protein
MKYTDCLKPYRSVYVNHPLLGGAKFLSGLIMNDLGWVSMMNRITERTSVRRKRS